MATKDSAKRRERKERLTAVKVKVEQSDYELKDFTEPDIERAFGSLNNHIGKVALYCSKLMDEMTDMCEEEEDDEGMVMIEGFRKDVNDCLKERTKRGSGIFADMQVALYQAQSTKDHLSYINELSIRIQGVIPIARKIEETRSKLDDLYGAIQKGRRSGEAKKAKAGT